MQTMSLYSQKHACVTIVTTYDKNWASFLSTFKEHDTYLVVDDNSFDPTEHNSLYPTVTIIQIENKICENAGFTHTCDVWPKNKRTFPVVGGWEKAIYYFSCINTSYDHVWFFEYDVFFKDETALTLVNNIFPTRDLVTVEITEAFAKNKPYPEKWWWPRIYQMGLLKIESGFFKSLPSITRCSKTLLSKIKAFSEEHGHLFFIEALFSVICKHNNLSCSNLPISFAHPPAAATVLQIENKVFNLKFLNGFFHSVKDTNIHVEWRKKMASRQLSIISNAIEEILSKTMQKSHVKVGKNLFE